MKMLIYMLLSIACSSLAIRPATDQAVNQPDSQHDHSQRLLDLAMETTKARELQEVRLRLKRGNVAEPPLFAIWDEVWIVPRAAVALGSTVPDLVRRPVAVLWPDGLCLQASPDSDGGLGVELRLVENTTVDRIVEVLSTESLVPTKIMYRGVTATCDSRYYNTFSREGLAATLRVELPGSTYRQLHLNGKFLSKDLLAMSKDAGVFELLRSSTRGRGVPIEKIGQDTIRGVRVNDASKALWFSRQ